MAEQEDTKYALRLPTELYEWVKQLADKEERSINRQVIALLREARALREKQTGPAS